MKNSLGQIIDPVNVSAEFKIRSHLSLKKIYDPNVSAEFDEEKSSNLSGK